MTKDEESKVADVIKDMATHIESLHREIEELRHNLKKCVEYMTSFTRLSNSEDEANHRKAITEKASTTLASTGGDPLKAFDALVTGPSFTEIASTGGEHHAE